MKQQGSRSARWMLSPKWLAIGAVLAVSILALMSRASISGERIDRNALVIGVVRAGKFAVDVEGYGTLRSNSKRLITSSSKATVEQIVLKPGARVEPDSVILRLSNPTVEQELDVARQQLEAEKTGVEELALSQQRELQDEDVKLEELQFALELAEARKAAFDELKHQGIVSRLEYAENEVKVKQLRGNIAIQRQRYRTLQQINRKKIEIHGRLVAQKQLSYETALERKSRLVVKAGESGVMQALHVELGQNIEAGAALALVGGSLDLNALIKIPQSKVDLVQIGQPARINIGDRKVPARVVQINPAVVDGSVTVELLPEEALPGSARPDLNVDASIDVGTYEHALFVERPANVKPNSVAKVYRLDADQETAEQVQVRFGQDSGRLIQIEAGLATDARIILTDLSRYGAEKTLRIE